jgi:hypothetical protein
LSCECRIYGKESYILSTDTGAVFTISNIESSTYFVGSECKLEKKQEDKWVTVGYNGVIFLYASMNELAPDRNVRARIRSDNFKKPLTAAEYRVVKKFWTSTPEDSFTLAE